MTATLTINGRRVTVDIERELREYDWNRAIWQADKLLAVSPFRYDKSPSFYVYLAGTTTARAGDWGDSGGEGEYARGGFVKLLAFLRNEDEYSTREYLLSEYLSEFTFVDENYVLEVPELTIANRRRPLDKRILSEYAWRHPYLETERAIPEGIQRLYGVGYDRKRRCVTMPWYNADGSLANVKYRRVDSKVFWYAKDARPIRECVYGIHIAYERRIKRAAIVEAEVDAQTIAAAGTFAIATGGSAFNAMKRDIILRSPIEELVIVADHDAAGQRLKRQIIEFMRGKVTVKVAGFPKRWKDANEMAVGAGLEALQERVENAREVKNKFKLL